MSSIQRNGKPEDLITYSTGDDVSYVTLQVAEYFPEGNESENTEYKQLWRSDFLKVISAFANTKGGVLHIGLDDWGKPVGVQNTKKLLEDIPNTIRNKLGIVPSIKLYTEEGKEVIEIEVVASSVPISFNGKFYVRSGSTVQELRGKNLSDFLLKNMNMTWDEQVDERASFDDLNKKTIERFKRLARARIPSVALETDTRTLLEKLNLFNEKGITKAAILLFGKNIQKHYHQAALKIGKFLSETEIQSTDIITGNLFEQLESSLEVLKLKYLRTNTHFEGLHRMDVLEYPYDALRETIINALIHREYFSTSQTQIRVYSDKLVIMNDGELPEQLSEEDLKHQHRSIPRNTLLAQVFYQAGFIESWGSGTIKIVDNCLALGLPEPDFNEIAGGMTVTLYKNIWDEQYLRKLNLNQRQIEVVRYVKEHGRITNHEYVKTFKASVRNSSRALAELVSMKILQRFGAGKEVYYTLYNAINSTINGTSQMPANRAKYAPKLPEDHEVSLEQSDSITLDKYSDSNAVQENTTSDEEDTQYVNKHVTDQVTGHDTGQVTDQVPMHLLALVRLIKGEMASSEIMEKIGLVHKPTFRKRYLKQAVTRNLIEMTLPEKPTSSKQKYRLTLKGSGLRKKLKAES